MCDIRLKGKKATSEMPNDGKYCRSCSIICDFEIYHLIPVTERSTYLSRKSKSERKEYQRKYWLKNKEAST